MPPAVDHGPDIALRQPIDGPLAEEIGTFCEHNGVQLYPAWAKFYQGVAAARMVIRGIGIAIIAAIAGSASSVTQ